MMTQRPSHASESHWLVVGGICLIVLGFFAPIRVQTDQLRALINVHVDRSLTRPATLVLQLQTMLSQSGSAVAQLSNFEQENRKLYADLASCRELVLDASASATSPKDEKYASTKLSFAGGVWIALAGTNQGVHEGNLVIVDGVMLGRVSDAHATYSSIETVDVFSIPMLVEHERSHQQAVFRSDHAELLVQFSRRIETLENNDIFTTVPDGENSRQPYPVFTLQSLRSGVTESVSIVRVKPIANPSIGQSVIILLNQN